MIKYYIATNKEAYSFLREKEERIEHVFYKENEFESVTTTQAVIHVLKEVLKKDYKEVEITLEKPQKIRKILQNEPITKEDKLLKLLMLKVNKNKGKVKFKSPFSPNETTNYNYLLARKLLYKKGQLV